MFADLFTDVGRRSVPPMIVAVVMVLQRIEGLCRSTNTRVPSRDNASVVSFSDVFVARCRRFPSGEQSGAKPTPSSVVSGRSPGAVGVDHIDVPVPVRTDRKAICVEPGDHTGIQVVDSVKRELARGNAFGPLSPDT
jgi:hypothetical protein